MDNLLLGNIDAYAELGVVPNASNKEVARAYRQKALLLHPDKNPGAEEQFQQLSLIYSVLRDANLRRQYDEYRNHQKLGSLLPEQIRRFQENLRRAESQATAVPSVSEVDLDRIRMETLRYRRQMETHAAGPMSFRDLEIPIIDSLDPLPMVVVAWKIRAEQESQIDAALLTQIMSIFGTVEDCKVGRQMGKYATATVTFLSTDAADSAVAHDYQKSASLWDGTEVRKLSSLLRGCWLTLTAFEAAFSGRSGRGF